MIPYTKNFTKETFLGRLEVAKFDLKQFGMLEKVEIVFSALSVKPSLAKNTSVQGEIFSSSKTVEEKINEGVTLILEREVHGKKILNVGHVIKVEVKMNWHS